MAAGIVTSGPVTNARAGSIGIWTPSSRSMDRWPMMFCPAPGTLV